MSSSCIQYCFECSLYFGKDSLSSSVLPCAHLIYWISLQWKKKCLLTVVCKLSSYGITTLSTRYVHFNPYFAVKKKRLKVSTLQSYFKSEMVIHGLTGNALPLVVCLSPSGLCWKNAITHSCIRWLSVFLVVFA